MRITIPHLSNLEITQLSSGSEVTNVIPAFASLRFNIRFNDNWTAVSLKQYIEQTLQVEKRTDITVRWLDGCSDSFVCGAEHYTGFLIEAIEEVVVFLLRDLSETGCAGQAALNRRGSGASGGCAEPH